MDLKKRNLGLTPLKIRTPSLSHDKYMTKDLVEILEKTQARCKCSVNTSNNELSLVISCEGT